MSAHNSGPPQHIQLTNQGPGDDDYPGRETAALSTPTAGLWDDPKTPLFLLRWTTGGSGGTGTSGVTAPPFPAKYPQHQSRQDTVGSVSPQSNGAIVRATLIGAWPADDVALG